MTSDDGTAVARISDRNRNRNRNKDRDRNGRLLKDATTGGEGQREIGSVKLRQEKGLNFDYWRRQAWS